MHLLTRLFTLLILAGSVFPVMAEDLHYEATLEDSAWGGSASPLLCTLSHSVDLFGRAEFYQEAGYQPGFRFFVNQPPIRKGSVTMHSRPPGWKHDKVGHKIGKYSYKPGESPFRFKRATSLRLMAELEKGMTPVFSFKDWGDGKDNVATVLSSVRFREALGKFRICTGKIIPYDYEKIRNTGVYFETAKSKLTAKARRQLDAVAVFLIRDPSVKNAKVEGHADDRGSHSYNNSLSEQRALAVREYLLKKQVPAEKLLVRYFGKRKPIKSNTSNKGRALIAASVLFLCENKLTAKSRFIR